MSDDPKKQETHNHQCSRDASLSSGMWVDGLICAFEYIRGNRRTPSSVTGFKFQHPKARSVDESHKPVLGSQYTDEDLEAYDVDTQSHEHHLGCFHPRERYTGNYWIPIGWNRISQLLQTVQADAGWACQPYELDDEEDVTVADVAAPYWERPVGPTWWCHVDAAHPFVVSWLGNAQWLHPAIRTALLDENRLISERMKHLLYEVPVRVAGGLLFELLGQSVGDPYADEDDIPVVMRSWQAQNFLLTAMHVKGSSSNINVLGVSEVQELLAAGGSNIPRTSHEIVP